MLLLVFSVIKISFVKHSEAVNWRAGFKIVTTGVNTIAMTVGVLCLVGAGRIWWQRQ